MNMITANPMHDKLRPNRTHIGKVDPVFLNAEIMRGHRNNHASNKAVNIPTAVPVKCSSTQRGI